MQEKPQLTETATAFTDFFSQFGKKFEIYSEDTLRQKKGYQIYDNMLRDPQVKAAFNVVVDLIASRDYRFEKSLLDDEELEEEIIKLFNYNIESFLKESFTQALRKILMAKAYGFSVCEKNYDIADIAGSERWLLSSLKLKPYNSFTFEVDDYGNLLSIIQEQKNTRKKLDPSKFLIYINQPELDEVYGESDLRSVYRSYWEKDQIQNFWNIWTERLAGGFITVHADKDAPALSPAQKADFDSVLSNITKQTSIRMPSGFQLDIKNPISTDAFEKAIAYRDRQISRGLLVPGLAGYTEQQGTGSFSQAQVQKDIFYNVIENQAKHLEEVLNEQLFKELAYWNFGVKDFPKFRFEKYTDQEKRELALAWVNAVKEGTVVNTYQDELRTRELLQYDPREEEDGELETNGEGKEDQVAKEEISNDKDSNISKDMSDKTTKEDQNLNFNDEDPTPAYEKRVNFAELETQLDGLEQDYFDEVTSVTNEIFQDLINAGREILSAPDVKEKPEKYLTIPDDDIVTTERKKGLRSVFIKELNKGYRLGRSVAKDEMEKALKSMPDRSLSESLISKLAFTRKVAVKFTGEGDFSVLNFVDNISMNDFEKFIRAQGFYLTGDVTNEMLARFRVILEKSIINEWDIDTFTEELGSVMTPYLDSGVIQVEGKVSGSKVEAIARTTLSNVFNQAQLSVFTSPELSDFVEALQYSAIMDNRTTKFCNSYHGRIFKIDDPVWGQITPPNHFRCRSRCIAVTVLDRGTYKLDKPAEDSKGNLIQPSGGFGVVK